MTSIRKEISRIFGFTIPTGEWKSTFHILNKDGRLTHKHVYLILAVLLEREEERERSEK